MVSNIRSHSHATMNQLCCSGERLRDTKEDKGEHCMHCNCCGWQKGISRAEATLNSKEIKPVALVIVELRWSEGIRQSVSYCN